MSTALDVAEFLEAAIELAHHEAVLDAWVDAEPDRTYFKVPTKVAAPVSVARDRFEDLRRELCKPDVPADQSTRDKALAETQS